LYVINATSLAKSNAIVASNYISVFLLNATSLAKANALQLLATELSQLNCHCAFITETWFTKSHSDIILSIADYNLYRRDRIGGRGGGVCIYVRSNITCSIFLPGGQSVDRLAKLEILWLECSYVNYHYFLACCYHPPSPRYDPVELCNLLSSDIDYINNMYDDAIIIVAGDFNQLNTTFLECDLGLQQMVSSPTHCDHLIDKIFVNRPDLYTCSVFSSVLHTKHKAVLLTHDQDGHPPHTAPNRRKVPVYDLRTPNIDRLRFHLGVYPWECLMQYDDVKILYDQFVSKLFGIVSDCVPCKTVALGPKDPKYVTPLVKSLLKQRNRLRRKGRVDEADSVAQKINKLIIDVRSMSLQKLSSATSKELWSAVNNVKNPSCGSHNVELLHNPDTVNSYFANIAHKDMYDPSELDRFRCPPDNENFQPLTSYEVERLLRNAKLSAAGCDHIPAWLLRTCSYELADIVAYIINCSISTGNVPSQWLNAVVTPVPKVPRPVSLSEYRPISVTSHLCRITEKIIVQRWLLPAIPRDALLDQFAFKRTGSTTAALAYFTHQLTKMLENNDYVRCLMVDFSKAFDTVDHVILLHKLSRLNVPSFVINWICSYLSCRGQQCKINNNLSSIAHIGLSIVQGSAIGPSLYIVMKLDLKTVSSINVIFKYADDTTLLVPQHTDTDLAVEFNNIKQWASTNHLRLNLSKTKEMVFRRPRAQYFHMPLPVDQIDQLDSYKLLGVIFQSNLKMDLHVLYVLSQCAQRMYLLKLLSQQGMTRAQLSVITHAIIISRILYALPVWRGFLSSHLVAKIDALFKRLKRYGYINRLITVYDLANDADSGLFKQICSPNHCLHHLLPPVRPCDNLRSRGHTYQLPAYCNQLHKSSFLIRSLYDLI